MATSHISYSSDVANLSQSSPIASQLPAIKRDNSLEESSSHVSSPAKKVKQAPEEPSFYSDSVRKKLAATNRTGQACDRCKERKMRCDPNPVACMPCRGKGLRCFTTDRVTGQSRERGQTDRVEYEIHYLKDQLAAYQRKYGPLSDQQSNFASPIVDQRSSQPVAPVAHTTEQTKKYVPTDESSEIIPSSKYVGWPSPALSAALHRGPLDGTIVDLLEFGSIDTSDFDSDIMHEFPPGELGRFNFSMGSVVNSVARKQQVSEPAPPPKQKALTDASHFLSVIWPWCPVLHKTSFLALVERFCDDPSSVSLPEKLQVFQVLAIIAHQSAIRNHVHAAENMEKAYRYLHYCLGHYIDMMCNPSLAAMQALALTLIHFRNFPKPGWTWLWGNRLLVRCIDQDYHRDPDKIKLPPADDNPLAKELRKRVFHCIIGVCVTTGCRLGRPSPWQFSHWDVPLPMIIRDDEISEQGISNDLSGQCDFWGAVQLSRLLPLMTELWTNVQSVRKSPQAYLKTVDALRSKLDAWRAEWDECVRVQPPTDTHVLVAVLLVDSWAAEFLLNLYHPKIATCHTQEVQDRNLEHCHKAAKRLLRNFHILSDRWKACDFTWHSMAAYALGIGVTLHYYQQKLCPVTTEQWTSMKNELAGWYNLLAYADLVLRTGNHLTRSFKPHIKAVEDMYEQRVIPDQNVNGQATPNSFTHANGPPSRSASRSEVSMQQPSSQQSMPTPQSYQQYQQPSPQAQQHDPMQITHIQQPPPYPQLQQFQQPYPQQTNFMMQPPSQMQHQEPPPMQNSFQPTSQPAYPQLPNSLAPLLNSGHAFQQPTPHMSSTNSNPNRSPRLSSNPQPHSRPYNHTTPTSSTPGPMPPSLVTNGMTNTPMSTANPQDSAGAYYRPPSASAMNATPTVTEIPMHFQPQIYTSADGGMFWPHVGMKYD